MLGLFFLAILLIPLVEVSLLIKIGQHLGAGTTILIVVTTGVAGAFFAKYQGLKVLWELRHALTQNIMPGAKMIEGLLVLIGGIFLLTPGLITDTLGLLFLIPLTRRFFRNLVIRWLELHMKSGRIKIYRR